MTIRPPTYIREKSVGGRRSVKRIKKVKKAVKRKDLVLLVIVLS